MSRIISIQSHVLHGHVGNAAAVPVMVALGAQVTAVPTTLLSNHPHYRTMRGAVLEPALVADLLLGVEERGLVDEAAILVTGFLGSPGVGTVVADFVERALQRNPGLRYVCDPVMGDEDLGSFAAPGLVEIIRERLLPCAWLATPNRWEAELLSGRAGSRVDLVRAVAELGLDKFIVTGGHSTDRVLGTLVFDDGAAWAIDTPRLPVRPAGTGDLFTGAVAARLAAGSSLLHAALHATGITFRLLERTGAAPWSEMPVETHVVRAVGAPAVFAAAPILEVAR